ncbi:hypothetical protein ACJX0J_012607 [Zea mays]
MFHLLFFQIQLFFHGGELKELLAQQPDLALFQIQNNRMKHLNVTTLDETSSEDVKQDDTILDLQHTSQQAPSSSDISEKLYPQITIISTFFLVEQNKKIMQKNKKKYILSVKISVSPILAQVEVLVNLYVPTAVYGRLRLIYSLYL